MCMNIVEETDSKRLTEMVQHTENKTRNQQKPEGDKYKN